LNKLKITQLGILLWAGMVWEDETLTPKSVMRMVDEHSSIVEATQKATAAIFAAFPQIKEVAPVKNPKRA
jgi:hypothetical protein